MCAWYNQQTGRDSEGGRLIYRATALSLVATALAKEAGMLVMSVIFPFNPGHLLTPLVSSYGISLDTKNALTLGGVRAMECLSSVNMSSLLFRRFLPICVKERERGAKKKGGGGQMDSENMRYERCEEDNHAPAIQCLSRSSAAPTHRQTVAFLKWPAVKMIND